MEHDERALAPTRALAARVRELREKRRLTAAQLAAAMTRAGIKWDRSTVAKLETGRRENVSVAELLALAYVLEVAPVHLLVPLDDDQLYQVTPGRVEPARSVRRWVRGAVPLDGTDPRAFWSEVPADEWDWYEAMRQTGEAGEVQTLLTMARGIADEFEKLQQRSGQQEPKR